METEIDAESRTDAFYEKALVEIEEGELEKSLWARALVTAEGDEQRARAVYIKIRVERLEKRHLEQLRVSSVGVSDCQEKGNTDVSTTSDEIDCKWWQSVLTSEVAMSGYRKNPETLLISAAKNGSVAGTAKAIEFGADINFKTNLGATALYVAVVNDKTEVAKFLLKAGAKRSVVYFDGETAAGYVEKKGSREMRDLFGEKL